MRLTSSLRGADHAPKGTIEKCPFLEARQSTSRKVKSELMDCLQFGACTANVLQDMAGLLGGLFLPAFEASVVTS